MLSRIFSGLVGRSQRNFSIEEVRNLVKKGDLKAAQAAVGKLYDATPQRELLKACVLAEVAFRENRDAEAESGFRQVLREAPGFPDAHFGLSLLLHEKGDIHMALQHAQFAKGAAPNDDRYLSQLGLCHLTLGNFPIAEAPLRRALRLSPADATTWNNLGLVMLAKSQAEDAHACFSKALSLSPGFDLAARNLAELQGQAVSAGIAFTEKETEEPNEDPAGSAVVTDEWEDALSLARRGDFDGAIGKVEALTLSAPDNAQLACKLETLYRSCGDPQSGIDVLNAFLARHPQDPVALMGLGVALVANLDYEAGERVLRSIRDDSANNADFLANYGQALHQQQKYTEAVSVLREAVALDSDPSVKAQFAAALVMACEYDEAIALYENLLAEGLSPRNMVLGGYTSALAYVGRFNEAISLLDGLLERQPHDPNLRAQRCQIHLLLENFIDGWEDYSFRGLSYSRNYRVLPFDRWRGDDLTGRCIVVLAEQGLGDQVMFSSCVPDLFRRGASRVVMEAIDRVAPTLARSFPQVEVISTRQDKDLAWAKDLGSVDCFVPLADLPRYFREKSADFPREAYLKADPERVAAWRRQLEAEGPGPYIGVSWRGGTELTRKVLRSMSALDLLALQSFSATWVCLQYGKVKAEVADVNGQGMALNYWQHAIDDLDEFSALVSALDGVVTVCNTTVHYAGALGKKVWVMAPHIPEWRYGLTNARMPWYPDVVVVRQPVPGDWQTVFSDTLAHLNEHFCR